MGFRTIFVKDGEKLNLKLDNLQVKKHGETYTIPLEDIQSIILEGYDTVITTRLLARLSKYHIPIVVCDQSYLPTGIFLELSQYHRASKRVQHQAKWSQEMKDLVWQKIIQMKVGNQLWVAKKLSTDLARIDKMQYLLNEIEPGDATNREGHVAKLYFNAIYGVGFSRDMDYIENLYMDYGYSIIRSQIAKDIVAMGLQPALGIFHKNEYNAFNLVDDLMEPFRPIMDWYIHTKIIDENNYLTYDKRLKIINFLNQTMRIKGRNQLIYQITIDYIRSFIKVMEENNLELLMNIRIEDWVESDKNEV